jgi:hypothetical protein
VGNGGAGAGEARGTEESGAGQQVRGTWPAKAAGFTGASRSRAGGGAGGCRQGPTCDFPKIQGLHCKA